jgi:hypothetical protein
MPVTTQVPVLAGQCHRFLDHLTAHLADRDDDFVGHQAVGQVDHRRDGGRHRLVDMGGAEFDGLLAFDFDRIDRDHVLGAGEHGALQRAHPDAADADDCHGLTRRNLGEVGGRAEARRYCATQDRG